MADAGGSGAGGGRRWVARVAIVCGVVLGVAAVAFLVWAATPLGPAENALAALESGGGVEVTQVADWWLFEPEGADADTGLVFYPGGRVDPRSYAPLCRAIAAEGYTVALASMPLNLAVLDADRAATLMDEVPGVSRWAIAGHSLGGAMACEFAAEGDPRLRGLALLAAYPADSTDLSDSGLAVLSALGTNDLVVDRAVWDAAMPRLPSDATYLEIDGGNHAQFGDYGEQRGDGEPTVSAEEQQAVTADAIVDLLAGL